MEYFDRKFEKILEPEIALTVGEYANVEISLDQKIKGIELGLSNCTVFGEGENDSFGVVDYPGCPDKIVKASVFDGESQEKVYFVLPKFIISDIWGIMR